jgi:hypothetical protein
MSMSNAGGDYVGSQTTAGSTAWRLVKGSVHTGEGCMEPDVSIDDGCCCSCDNMLGKLAVGCWSAQQVVSCKLSVHAPYMAYHL